MMSFLRSEFEERLAEVDEHLDLLVQLEACAASGPPRFEGSVKTISVNQQRILYSTLYLQLYNLVESTMNLCFDYLAKEMIANRVGPGELAPELRREWVRLMAKTHIPLTDENRLNVAMQMAMHLVASLPISDFEIAKGGGGNWDHLEIEKMLKRLGVKLKTPRLLYRRMQRRVRDDLGPIALVKKLRNDLAHGSTSFVDGAGAANCSDLMNVRNTTADFMRVVVMAFERYIENVGFRMKLVASA